MVRRRIGDGVRSVSAQPRSSLQRKEVKRKIRKKELAPRGARVLTKAAPVHDFAKNTVEKKPSSPKRVPARKPQRSQSNNYLHSFVSFLLRNKTAVKRLSFVFVYMLLIVLISSYFEKTIVTIEPVIQNKSEQKIVDAYSQIQKGELVFHVMSVQDKRGIEVIPASEKQVEEFATGTIKVFNDYSREPQRLSAHTRFESVSGKVFLIGEEGLLVPGRTSAGPGVVEVAVTAQKPGDAYNIDVTDFTIPGFKEAGLDEKYNGIYGLSVKSFSGGFSGIKKVIDEKQKEDVLVKIKKDLEKLLIQRINSEKTEKGILVQDSIRLDYSEPVVLEKKDGNLDLSLHAKAFALVVKRDQLQEYFAQLFFDVPETQDIFVKNTTSFRLLKPLLGDADFLKLKQVSLEMNAEFTATSRFDKSALIEKIRGKKKTELLPILKNMTELDYIKVQIEPFWQKYVSKNPQHILLRNK